MDADGTNQTNVTTPAAVSAWSPDGQKIAFIANYDIFTMNADGSNKVKLTRGPALDWWPDWQPLPDGDRHDRRR